MLASSSDYTEELEMVLNTGMTNEEIGSKHKFLMYTLIWNKLLTEINEFANEVMYFYKVEIW